MVTFNPPSVDGSYEVELRRRFSLSCMFNRNIYPTPIQFEVSRASGGMCNFIAYLFLLPRAHAQGVKQLVCLSVVVVVIVVGKKIARSRVLDICCVL